MKAFKIGTKDISVELTETEFGSRMAVVVKDNDPNAVVRIQTEYVGTIPVDGKFFIKSQGRKAIGRREKAEAYDNGRLGGPYDLDDAQMVIKEYFTTATTKLGNGSLNDLFIRE